MPKKIVIIGGGAAGIFSAIACGEANPSNSITVLEKTNTLLAKVRISGGGRCNVTHSCFEPNLLIKNYPRGSQALIGPLHRFQPQDTIHWFESRGVNLKTEEDGRIFPTTDSSQTIIDCLLQQTAKYNVEILLKHGVEKIEKQNDQFLLTLESNHFITADHVLIATGSRKEGYQLAQQLGHHIVNPVPSLFSFNIPHFSLVDLAGISVEHAEVKLSNRNLSQSGPLLITHWGFSGPAALKLSAWEARTLFEHNYKGSLIINWLPSFTEQQLLATFLQLKERFPAHSILKENRFDLPKNLWTRFLTRAQIDPQTRLNDISHKAFQTLAKQLHADSYPIDGKTPYKSEFVTCGGVCLDEVNFKTMESRICPGLYFAGEVLDIDGVTGGFNFQNAWTSGWIAGNSAA